MPDTHTLSVMDKSGDQTVIRWNRNNQAEVEAARETFDAYRRRGFSMFVLDADDHQGRRLDSFDPSVRGIIGVPAMQGG